MSQQHVGGSSSWVLRLLVAALCSALLGPSAAQAQRRYPITKTDGTGAWIGTKRGLLNGRGELWQRFWAPKSLPSNHVTDVELSPRDVWVTTTAGLARLNKGSRRWDTYGAAQLPSTHATAVSLDPSDPFQVWVGTKAGLAHYNVRTNRWRTFGKGSGLPSLVVNDVFVRGRTVWAGTDAGLAAYDVKLGTWKVYRKRDGIAGKKVLQIEEQGEDLWLTCDQGQTRMNLQRRMFSSFTAKQGLPSPVILAQARLQTLIYLVTDKGVITYDISSDSLTPFLYRKGLQGAKVGGVTAAGGFLWFATTKGIARFEPTKKTWQYFTIEDGLSSEGATRISVAGSFVMVFGNEGTLDSYSYRKDEWIERTALLARKKKAPSTQPTSQATSQPTKKAPQLPRELRLSVSAELDTELKEQWRYTDGEKEPRDGYWLVNKLRLGAGVQWPSGRKVDISGKIDWGDIEPVLGGDGETLKSFQSYDFELRYLGLPEDLLQEAVVSDELRLAPLGPGRLAELTEYEGARVALTAGPKRRGGRFARLQVAAGLRRGTPARRVFRRLSVATLKIKRFMLFREGSTPRKVIANSVRVLLDGRELDRNVDYFVDHDNGVLWLKNTALLHALRVLEVEFEYEQIPRKNVGAVSMTGLLPRDGDIGQLKRSGASRWARDEDGLFAEINGGAEQFIQRNWTKSLFQDFEWGSAGVKLLIYDMQEEKNANLIFVARRAPDAKLVPGLEGVVIETQPASITVKLVRGQFYIEITIDQGTMEQEILAIAGWLVSKLTISGSTSADALRDYIVTTALAMRVTDNTRVGLRYIGTFSRPDKAVKDTQETAQDLLAVYAAHERRLGKDYRLDVRLQAAGTMTKQQDGNKQKGSALAGRVLVSGERALVRATVRKYTAHYGGIGVARQTEFCRRDDQRCLVKGSSRLDYEIGADATVRPARWLPVKATWQRQVSKLGKDEYKDAPEELPRIGRRDVVSGSVGLDTANLPKIELGGGYIRRSTPLALANQWRATGALENDLGNGLLKPLKFRKIYVRALYEYGVNDVDEFRYIAEDEEDRRETMHHALGELRIAPTLTENAYATIEYHRLQGVLDANQRIAERLVFWRLDVGAGSSYVPGIAVRLDSTFLFGDEQPRPEATTVNATVATEVERQQEVSSRLTGTLDIFPGEWFKPLSPVRINTAYTYTEEKTSRARRQAKVDFGKEVCDVPGDEDGDTLEDCADPDCAFAEICLFRLSKVRSHRVFGTLSWTSPGKIQAQIFGDMRFNYAGKDDLLRSQRYELRSAFTWRPIQSSPVTARFDLLREVSRPDKYDGLEPLVEPKNLTLEPTIEWRRRWSVEWWHLAKITVTRTETRDLPYIRTKDSGGIVAGTLERQDFNEWAVRPSLEVRRRFDAKDGTWSFRPYVRTSYKYRLGDGLRSRLPTQTCLPGDPCFTDGSQTSHLVTTSLGLIWVHGENVYVDFDFTASYQDCIAATVCRDVWTISPHLLATARF